MFNPANSTEKKLPYNSISIITQYAVAHQFSHFSTEIDTNSISHPALKLPRTSNLFLFDSWLSRQAVVQTHTRKKKSQASNIGCVQMKFVNLFSDVIKTRNRIRDEIRKYSRFTNKSNKVIQGHIFCIHMEPLNFRWIYLYGWWQHVLDPYGFA